MTGRVAVFYARCVVYAVSFVVWIITETSTSKIFKP
jgi:hypothetical protein